MSGRISYIPALPIVLFMLSACGNNHRELSETNREIFALIDQEIEKVPLYDSQKNLKITKLKSSLSSEESPETRKFLIDKLIEEYEAYESDSALYYINLNLENPIVKEDKVLQTDLLIKQADVAAHAGLFGESQNILESIDRAGLDPSLLEKYYYAYCDLYQYQSEYTTDSEYARNHERLRELYIDSISQVASPTSFSYVVNHAASEARSGNFSEAKGLLLEQLEKYLPGDRNYSILASILADIYKQNGDKDNYLKYISLSVISDIKGAVKENMAIRALATECYEEGDIERADRYLRQSFADANFYAARMRNAQSSRMLPIIGEAYTAHQKKLNRELRLFVIFISILALGFILISIFAFIQVRKVRAVNKKTKDMLEEVSQLSQQMSQLNKDLTAANEQLESSNAIKGEYAVLFMEYCSLAISSLHSFRQSLRVAAAQGNMQGLIKKIDSANVESKILAEFYSKFDEAILNIYPNFVEKFNSLLREEERINIKPKEGLNTELRVFALIRMGITDSEKIATFLRCSLSTVYTYRSKTKKKAIDSLTFDNDITSI